MEFVGWTDSVLIGEKARVYRFIPFAKELIIRAFAKENATFTIFAKATSGSDTIRVFLEGPFSAQTEDFAINSMWQRLELTITNLISLAPLQVFLATRNAIRKHSDIALAFAQIEDRLFSTTPILPDIPLPAISSGRDEGVGATRAEERTWLKEESFAQLEAASATIIAIATPNFHTAQVAKTDFMTFFSLWSETTSTEVSFGISGSHGARFVIRKRKGGKSQYSVSSIIAGKDQYFMCAVFDQGAATLIVDGLVAATLEIDSSMKFTRQYLGSCHGESADALNGTIQRYMSFSAPLILPRILEIFEDLCPEKPQYIYDYMFRYFRYAITEESARSTFKHCRSASSFSVLCRQLARNLPLIFEQFAPGKHFTEEQVRDWVYALMRGSAHASRESYTKIGRTDLLLTYEGEESGVGSSGDPVPVQRENSLYRIEFKIWGRAGYDEVPTQPIKYMGESELVGVLVMIDRRASADLRGLQNIVANNIEYPCLAVNEVPLLDMNVRYFLSFHKDARIRMARMMINVLIPILS